MIKKMPQVISEYCPSLILCAYSPKLADGNPASITRKLLQDSLKIAKKSHIPSEKNCIGPCYWIF